MMVTKTPTPTPTKPAAKRRTPVKPIDVSASSTSAVDTIAAGTTLVHEIAIALIDPHPRNPRQALGELGELAESIRAHGVKQPVTVIPHPNVAGRFMTVMGHRRVAAAMVAGRTTVPVIVDDTMDVSEQLQVMLVENLQRVDLTISEEGAGYQGLLDLGVVKAEIIRRTGRAKNTVDARLRIAALPESVRRHVDHHQLTIEEALTFAEWKETHPDVWEEQLQKLSNPHVMVDVVMGEAKRKVSALEARSRAIATVAEAGHKLVIQHKMVDFNDPGLISRLGIDREAHAHCPGAEVHITGDSEDWLARALSWGTYRCSDVEKYHPTEFAERNAPKVETEADRKWRENRDRQIAESQAQQAKDAQVANDRRQWLLYTLTTANTPAHDALAACAAEVGRIMLTQSVDDTWLLDSVYPSDAVPEDAVLPTDVTALLTLTLLLVLDQNLNNLHVSSIESHNWNTFPAEDLALLCGYLEACAEHGHVLDESEQALIEAARAAIAEQEAEPAAVDAETASEVA